MEATVKRKMLGFKKSACDVCSCESIASVSVSGRELLRGCYLLVIFCVLRKFIK